MTSNITFCNQPKLSGDAADVDFDKRRTSLIPHIKDYLSAHEQFKRKEINVTFKHEGVSSLVCILEMGNEKRVLKIALSKTHSFGQALFLKVWEEAGVKVPHVFDDGMFDEHPYTLMEYIDAPTLSDAYTYEEAIEKGIYYELGQILRIMHDPEAQGYGRVIDNKGECETFEEWLESPDMKKRFKYVEAHGLLTDEHGSVTRALEILCEHVSNDPKSCYCHDDFGGANIFATNPPTIFDPNPRFNNRYMDLGKSFVNHIAVGVYPKQLLEGYFEEGDLNEQVLHASIFLNALMKLPYQHKKGRKEIMNNLLTYLRENEQLQ